MAAPDDELAETGGAEEAGPEEGGHKQVTGAVKVLQAIGKFKRTLHGGGGADEHPEDDEGGGGGGGGGVKLPPVPGAAPRESTSQPPSPIEAKPRKLSNLRRKFGLTRADAEALGGVP